MRAAKYLRMSGRWIFTVVDLITSSRTRFWDRNICLRSHDNPVEHMDNSYRIVLLGYLGTFAYQSYLL